LEGLASVGATLEQLIMYGNQIEVIEGLETMQKLKEANFKKNKIQSIRGLGINSKIV
jgi:Leucine-rich repeat (LRR) protein